MIRKIIQIDEEKCNGCGLCIDACHEGALQLIDGKAKLISESYCDGLGDCLPKCPVDAIKIIEREAEAFDEEAVKENMEKKAAQPLACGCPGTLARSIQPKTTADKKTNQENSNVIDNSQSAESQLRQWPCQIKLVPPGAPYFNNAHLLVAADCVAYAYAGVHNDFMLNKITIIGCPKLDDVDYSTKLAEILRLNEIKSITVLKMEVPCCGGIVSAVKNALLESGKMVPWNIVTISTDGQVLDN